MWVLGNELTIADPQDRRAVRATVTPLGAERQADGAKDVAKGQSALAESLSGMDQGALLRILSAIR